MRFENKVCIVTGAASGIGLATANRMASEGGRVAIVDLKAEAAEAAAQAIGEAAISLVADVGDAGAIQDGIHAVLEKWGRIDVLVNNAAMMTFQLLEELTVEQWDHVLAVNLRSVFAFCRGVAPHIQGGAIVNVSSVHAHETTANVIPYASSKGGMEAFCRAMSQEYPIEKLRINCVAPGAINTPMLWNNPNVKSGKEKITGKVGEPEDVAAAICFLASDEAKFINGTTLVVDGGRLDVL
ncbi:SDR family NAD(P)-dependent oxidoreductase [Fimbriimonas ginsengisoli]|uniref:3-oxoacyl-[acyl-carrier protein] reductase n=1 Tax=Fimbriimonas ginsengisoli Gsoil 348 TaxID=661478 RepID=A0A068NWU6_FIMGI|nr:SDR family oxidoreductase [Fimbriimonas ginsengisoli]AIE87255.1 3-oxoacyl-[acyl-carrier protein] reductase [Fimbriimonas ginsengisoli Gsoil 348]